MNNHKLAYFGGEGGLCLRVSVPVGILIRNDSARILKDGWLSSLASQDGATGGMTASTRGDRRVRRRHRWRVLRRYHRAQVVGSTSQAVSLRCASAGRRIHPMVTRSCHLSRFKAAEWRPLGGYVGIL